MSFRPIRVPLLFSYDPNFGLLRDALTEIRAERKVALARPAFVVGATVGVPQITYPVPPPPPPSLSLSISPTLLVTKGTQLTLVSGPATANPSGGSGGYTYSWVFLSGSPDIAISSTTSQTVTFSTSGMAPSEVRSAKWQCTVTDSASHTASATMTAKFVNTSTQ